MNSSGAIVSLERFWVASGEAYELTQDGWLAEPSDGTFYSINARITSTRDLARTRCLVLLGEPGIGKTSALNEGRDFRPDLSVPVQHFDLGSFSSEERLVSRVFESAELAVWRKGRGELCLSLDGFDEAYSRVETLPRLLVDFLNQCDCSRLYLRVACRTANWPAFLREALEVGFGEDSVRVQELLPLRRDDAATLLRAAGVDPIDVLTAVEAARVVPLAARPLTLNLLRAAIDPAGGFPQSASELYDKGLLALADEMNPIRHGTGFAAGSAAERLRVASRIAAISIFGGRPSIWIGHIAEAEDATITVDECLPTDFVAQAHATSSEVVDATLRTGLFTGNGESRLGWAHATFADYLTVRWMLASSLDDQQIESLLFAEDGQMYPRVRQVATWLVAMAPTRFRSFITRDPQAFLQNADIPEESLRAELVDALFAAARAGTFYDEYNLDLTGLGHAGLAAQVRQALADQSDDARRLALRIARQCLLTELVPDLTALALNPTAEVSLRVSAALDVRDLSEKSPSTALVGLLKPSGTSRAESPIHHELEGAALLASWPHAITTAEVFAMLSPRHPRNFIGMYSTFVRHFAAELTDADLAPACDWVLSNPDRLNDSRFAALVDAVTRLCISHLEDPHARQALRHVAFQRAEDYEPLFSERALDPAPELNDDQRRGVALVLLAEATKEQTWAMSDHLSNHGLRLLSEADLEWLIEQYRYADGTLRTNIATALHYLYRPDLVAHSDVVLGLSDNDPAAEIFSSWRAVVLLASPEAAQARAQWAQWADRRRKREERRATEAKDAWVNPKIAALAQSAVGGDVEAYWYAVRLVTVRPGTQRFMDEFQPDLTEHPRWKTLPATTHADLVAASVKYLRDGRCEPDRWLTKDVMFHPARAGYRALVLLLRERPAALAALPSAIWQEWAPIIIDWTVTVNGAKPDDKTTLIELAAEHARPEMVSTLLALIDRDIAEQKHVFARTELAALMSEDLASELVSRLDEATAKETRDSLLDALLAGGWISLVEPVLLRWIGDTERIGDSDRAAEAAMTLLQHAPTAGWPRLRTLLETDPEFIKKAFLTNRFVYDRKVPDLDDASLGDLYLRLRELFPPTEDPQFDDVHGVGPREALANWRDALLEGLRLKGTASAVQAIQALCDALPEETWLKRVLIDAKRILRDQSWQPLSPQELDQLTASQSVRLVRTDADLQNAALLALEGIQARLQGDTPSAPLLWDTHAARPKTEEEISDYLAIELNDRLGHAGAVVNREVQVRRIRPSGLPERTDLRFEAIPTDVAREGTASVKIPGEVKGTWNAGVIDSVSSQLVGRYMADFQTEYGIYIVVWFDQEPWADRSDRRRNAAARFAGIDDLRAQLGGAAAAAGGKVAVVVLNASIRRGA
ncbi:NACHT domain-containing protein [Nocardioides sp. NPDC057577]|uniref:NACHT domain-containing protein n=1 Tax=Nocardioides sp. NPDC057577 TaxID=3346171 RepID=UPI003672524F